MKAHIGVDAQTGLAHSMVTTAANESDVSQTHRLLHGEEKHVNADAGYQGAKKREALKDCAAEFVVARRRSTYKKLDKADPVRQLIEQAEHAKASIRAKVEHVFNVVKNLFRHRKCRYKRSCEEYGAVASAVRNGESGAVAANAMRAAQDSCVLRARNKGD
jgi:IS5 family transposase